MTFASFFAPRINSSSDCAQAWDIESADTNNNQPKLAVFVLNRFFMGHSLRRGILSLVFQNPNYHMIDPPLTTIICPVTYEDQSLARNKTAPTRSSGWPTRPKGIFLALA